MFDYCQVGQLFNQEQRLIQQTMREFVEAEITPNITNWWDQSTFPHHLIKNFAELGLLGINLPSEVGGAGLDNTTYGIAMYELERGDSGLRSFVSVQNSLVMYPIFTYGSDEQKKLLPELAKGSLIGCFGLTEENGGSDPASMRTKVRKIGNEYVLNGSKIWITNGSISDIAIIWAKMDNEIAGFVVPADTDGFTAKEIKNKYSLRASVTSELVFEDVVLPESARLPKANGLKAPLSCLNQARFGILWGALGALEAVLTTTLEFAKTRQTFNQPIAARQLVQNKLVEMTTDLSLGQLLAWRLSQLKDENTLSFAQVSLAKRNNVRKALLAARSAREILGASGIVSDYPVIRHMLNLETIDTYEGTFDIHTLIVGRDLTGFNALI